MLDPSTLITELGEVDASRAAERAATAEVARLQGLYKAGAGASLKNLEAAQAEQARARAQADAAATRFTLRWAPIASGANGRRQKIIDAVAAGKSALVRVDLPGQHSIGAVPETATLDIDGVAVTGSVLGVLAQRAKRRAPACWSKSNSRRRVSPSARASRSSLAGAARIGFLVPRGALIYEEGGAFVYHQLDAKPGDENMQYARKKVTLLMPSGDGWLVDGLDDDDLVVVHGAGVLWSLEGIGTMPEDDDD